MKPYIILLRGVNVGGKNKLPMEALRILLHDNGFQDVRTYIQSGNVILLSSKNPEKSIAKLIQAEFGFSPDVLVLSLEEFESAVSNNPYCEFEAKCVHFYFCKETPKLDKEKLESLLAATERYELISDVFYLYAPDGIGRSKLVTKIEACLGVSATGRNLNTARKLTEMIAKSGNS